VWRNWRDWRDWRSAVTVSPDQLAFDLEAMSRLVDQLRDRRRLHSGASRLLVAMVRAGLAERDLAVAAALCIELDNGRDEAREEWRR
jgi:hypothetical protein